MLFLTEKDSNTAMSFYNHDLHIATQWPFLTCFLSGPSCSKRRLLNDLVKGHFVNCFSRFNIQYSYIFLLKKCECKSYSHFFNKKFQHICVSLDVNFNESLTNDIVSFEQLRPGL